MYPSLKTPVMGSVLIPLNLTALYRRRRADIGAKRVLRTRCGSPQNLHRRRLLQGRQVEETCNPADVEQVQLFGAARETDRDNRRFAEQGVVLPSLQREVRQHIVVADHDIRRNVANRSGSRTESGCIGRDDAHLGKIPRYVLAEEAMTRDAKCAEWSSGGCLEIHAALIVSYDQVLHKRD